MGKLIYSMLASLDGYIADEEGNFDWSVPDEEVHAFINDFERPIATYLYGRRMYEAMIAWETMPTGPDQPSEIRDFAAIWRAADKIVYSTTLETVSSARTRIERRFDPAAIRQLKAQSASDISIGGPALAAHALRAGLVDECHLYINPLIVGGGPPVFPAGLCLPLALLDERRFGNGVTFLRYRTKP
ncbi:MAG: dihydrofolate reductase family protein [Thermomicrobiales bacterium]